ncbi:hypothetical protein GQX74_000635 [Glossina fuscipes]|nr:hypothetical protein GQX74_000635 [Glossina fuscipes]
MSRIYEKSISEISSQQPHIQQQQQPTLYQQQQSMLSNATTLTLGNSSLFNNNNNAMANANNFIGGFSSFDSDSLPDYSEFDSESVTLDYFKESYLNVFFCRSYHNDEPGRVSSIQVPLENKDKELLDFLKRERIPIGEDYKYSSIDWESKQSSGAVDSKKGFLMF